jgi:hypothetical protein
VAERPDGGKQDADPAALRAGYERLRAAVLSERPEGFRLGHGVLLTRGMLAWMQAFGSLAPPTPGGEGPERGVAAGGASQPGCDAPAVGVVPLPGADQLVAVLAQMALFHAA